jgi:hypothetical protein
LRSNTEGGENIAPVPIEDSVKKLCPALSNFMMVGDKRKFNVALVTLKAIGTLCTCFLGTAFKEVLLLDAIQVFAFEV